METSSRRHIAVKWTPDAETEIKKVPFFIRKKVRSRIENDIAAAGKQIVSLSDVKAAQARFMSKMNEDIKGYQVETCFGSSGCPNAANTCDILVKKIDSILENADLLNFLKKQVKGDLKYHHEFRVTLAECPNACSQPQIKDVGIIGAVIPEVTNEMCTGCGACVEACIEKRITLDARKNIPAIDHERCLKCGRCIQACPSETLAAKKKGFRIQLGGRLGRHPRLAVEVEGIFSETEVLCLVKNCIDYYKKHSKHGERFAEIFDPKDFKADR
ncbi:MAG: 4Fe-4S dicluster domain-containing protein [Desulfobacterales bacterium]